MTEARAQNAVHTVQVHSTTATAGLTRTFSSHNILRQFFFCIHSISHQSEFKDDITHRTQWSPRARTQVEDRLRPAQMKGRDQGAGFEVRDGSHPP